MTPTVAIWPVGAADEDAFISASRRSRKLHATWTKAPCDRPSFKRFLGYFAFAGHQRLGFMKQGMLLVARQAFQELGLHRVEANIEPKNVASPALAGSCGFRREDFSPSYLKVGGRWRDHERWALVKGAPLRRAGDR